jgi:hypothetical protein
MRVEEIYTKTENITSLAATFTKVLPIKALKGLENHPIEDITHVFTINLCGIPSSISTVFKPWVGHQPSNPVLKIKIDKGFDRNLYLGSIHAWSKKSLLTPTAIAVFTMSAVHWISGNWGITIKSWLISAMTSGVGTGGIYGVFNIKEKLSCSRMDVTREIRHEFLGVLGQLGLGAHECKLQDILKH